VRQYLKWAAHFASAVTAASLFLFADPRPTLLAGTLQSSSDVSGLPLLTVREGVPGKRDFGQKTLPPTSGFAGVLNIILPDGSRHYCSGAFVDSSVIVTAAHCVQANGATTRYGLESFVQETGSTMFNIAAHCVRTPVQWGSVTDPYLRIRYDYAFVRTTMPVLGTPKDISTANPYGRPASLLGYPSGGVLTEIQGTVFQDVLHPTIDAVMTTEMGFTMGTSGGPWINTANNKVLSVNSSYAPAVHSMTHMRVYGPLFDGVAAQLKTDAKNCTP